jgi:hypothetical protein
VEKSKNEPKGIFTKVAPVLEVLTFLAVALQSAIIVRQCEIMDKQTTQTDALFAYTKKRDSIQDRNDSIAGIRDSIANHFRDSSVSVSLEINRKQIELTSEANRLTNRPFISLKSIGFNRFDPNQKYRIELEVYNSGKVDAYDFESCLEISNDTVAASKYKRIAKCKDEGSFTIGAGLSQKVGTNSEFYLSQNQYDAITTGKNKIIVRIKGSYKRVNSTERYPFEDCRYLEWPDWRSCKIRWAP